MFNNNMFGIDISLSPSSKSIVHEEIKTVDKAEEKQVVEKTADVDIKPVSIPTVATKQSPVHERKPDYNQKLEDSYSPVLNNHDYPAY